jgi:hypothetical protein
MDKDLRKKQKVVAVLAGQDMGKIEESLAHVTSNLYADVFMFRLDALEQGSFEGVRGDELIERFKRIKKTFERNTQYELMVSLRRPESIHPSRLGKEGYKSADVDLRDLKKEVESSSAHEVNYQGFDPNSREGEKKDLPRVSVLRKLVQEVGIPVVELDHHQRRNFYLSPDQQTVILYSNHRFTPSEVALQKTFDEIVRVGADHVLMETSVRDHRRDGGKADMERLLEFANKMKDYTHPHTGKRIPLTIGSNSKLGGRLNLEAYKLGLSEYVFGTEHFTPIPLPFNTNPVLPYYPSIQEINETLGLKRARALAHY